MVSGSNTSFPSDVDAPSLQTLLIVRLFDAKEQNLRARVVRCSAPSSAAKLQAVVVVSAMVRKERPFCRVLVTDFKLNHVDGALRFRGSARVERLAEE